MKKILTLLAATVFAVGCASKSMEQSSSGGLDYGDYSSQVLTTKAWNALNAGDWMTAVQYTDKTIELYEEQAKEMQENMKAEVLNDGKKPAEEVHANWALNDVGTSYFIRGEAFMQMGKRDEALEAYKAVVNQYYYAQTWDPKGWFWTPSDAATPKVTELAGDF